MERVILKIVRTMAGILIVFLAMGAVVGLAARAGSHLTRSGELTARSVFWLLPSTMFENTPENLSADEKYDLYMQGSSAHWTIRSSSPDLLEIVSQPTEDSTVLLRLFRFSNGRGAVVAVGTDSGPICAAELWNVDAKGRATPVDTPSEPDIMDFFAPGTRVPPDVTASLPFCVRPEGLEVRPLFWGATGLAHVMVDRSVFYVWTGTRFSKRIVPLPAYPSPSEPAPQDTSSLYTLPDDFPDDALPDSHRTKSDDLD